MAYRDPPSTGGPSCHQHAAAPATAACHRCLQPICDICLVYELARPHCFPCAKKTRRNRAIGRASFVVVLLGVLGGAIGFVASRKPSFDYGLDAPKVAALRKKVEAERCDRKATVEYEDALVEAGDHRTALADVDGFLAKCGDYYRVHWTAYTAHRRLSENAQAVVEATKLIEHRPDDKDYRWWRGIAYEDLGRLDEAIADYREAIRLTPALTNIPFNLSSLLEKQGKYCEAAAPIEQFLQYHADSRSDPKIGERLVRLTTLGHCGAN